MSQPKDPGDEDSTSVCNGCSGPTESCIANANSLIPADDEGCAGCATGQKYWPCDVEGKNVFCILHMSVRVVILCVSYLVLCTHIDICNDRIVLVLGFY